MFMQHLKSLNTDETDQFNAEYDTLSYPVIFYFDRFASYDLGYVKWHWHYSPQFVTATDTTVELTVEQDRVILSPGESAFINSNRFHVIRSADPRPDDVSISILFMPEFIAEKRSLIYQKYVAPIIEDPALTFVHFENSVPWQHRVNQEILSAISDQAEHLPGCELAVRNHLSAAWFLLVRNQKHLPLRSCSETELMSQARIKKMVSFIYGSYMKEISLEDIAASASLSKSECNRCFRRYFQMTPFQFLIDCRLEHAAQLLRTTRDPIGDIARACGFQDPSYFNRLFRRLKGMTPTAFRKTNTPPEA